MPKMISIKAYLLVWIISIVFHSCQLTDLNKYSEQNPFITFIEKPRNTKMRKGDTAVYTCKFQMKHQNLLSSGAIKFPPNTCEWNERNVHIAIGAVTRTPSYKVAIDVVPNQTIQTCRLTMHVATSMDIQCKIVLHYSGNYAIYDDSKSTINNETGLLDQSQRFIEVYTDFVQLVVLNEPGPPRIEMSLNSGWIEHDIIKIICQSDYGNPPPEINLYMNNKKIGNDTNNVVVYEAPVEANSSTRLIIHHNVTLGDINTTISCSVKNEVIDSPMNIQLDNPIEVKFTPKLYIFPSSDKISILDKSNLHAICVALAEPQATLRWIYRDGTDSKELTRESRLITLNDLRNEDFNHIINEIGQLVNFDNQGTSIRQFSTDEKYDRLKGMVRIIEIDKTVSKSDTGKLLECQASNGLTKQFQSLRPSMSPKSSYQFNEPNFLPANRSLIIDVLYEPIVTSPPNVDVKEGETLRITCNIDSNPPPFKITWVKKEREISINYLSTDKVLIINNVTREHAGTYVCRADNQIKLLSQRNKPINKFGKYESQVNVLYPPGQPIIKLIQPNPENSESIKPSLQPNNLQRIVLNEGEPIKLSCGFEDASGTLLASGNPKPSFRWSKAIFNTPTDVLSKPIIDIFTLNVPSWLNSSEGDINRHLSELRNMKEIESSGPIFKINSVDEQDIGIYHCTPQNVLGTGKRSSIMVYVKASPKFVPQSFTQRSSQSNIIVVNASLANFQLECTFTGRPEPRVAWLHNGLPLHIPSGLSKPITLTSYEPPLNSQHSREFHYKLTHPHNLRKRMGVISKDVTSRSTNDWRSITNHNKYNVNSTSNIVSAHYVIRHTSYLNWNAPLEPNDRGVYTCLGFSGDNNQVNQNGDDNTAFSSAAYHNQTLKVTHPPVILRALTPSKVYVDEHGNDNSFTKTIKCLVFSDPMPEFNWRFNNHMLPKDLPGELELKYEISEMREIQPDTLHSSNPGMSEISSLFKTYESVLKINKLSDSDIGTYTCIVNNELGFNEIHIHLAYKGHPDKPKELFATDISSNTINITCRPGLDGGQAQTINIFYFQLNNDTLGNVLYYTTTNNNNPLNTIYQTDSASHTFKPFDSRPYLNGITKRHKEILGKYEIVENSEFQKILSTYHESRELESIDENMDNNDDPLVKKITLPVKFVMGDVDFKQMIDNEPDTYVDSYGESDIFASSTDVFFNLEGLNSNSKYIFWAESQNDLGTTQMDYKILVTTGFKEFSRREDIPAPNTATYYTINDTLFVTTNEIDGLCLSLIDHNSKLDVLFKCTGIPFGNDISSITIQSGSSKYDIHSFTLKLSELRKISLSPEAPTSIRTDNILNVDLSNDLADLGRRRSKLDSDGLYIKLCTVYDNSMCGPIIKTHIIDNAKPLSIRSPKGSILTITVSVIIIICLILMATFVIVCMKKNKDKMLKDYEMKHALHSRSTDKKTSFLQQHSLTNSLNKKSMNKNGNVKRQSPDANQYNVSGNGNYPNNKYERYNDINLHNPSSDFNNNYNNGGSSSIYRNGSLIGPSSNGGFINQGMDMIDEKESNYNNTAKRSNAMPLRFRTPEDLLLAASLEEDDDNEDENNVEDNENGCNNYDETTRSRQPSKEYYQDFGVVRPRQISPYTTSTNHFPPSSNQRTLIEQHLLHAKPNYYETTSQDRSNNNNVDEEPYGRNDNLQNITNPNFSIDPSPPPFQSIARKSTYPLIYNDETSSTNLHNSMSETSSQRVMHEVIV